MHQFPEQIEPVVVEAALAEFGLSGRAQFLGGSQNHVFAVECAGRPYILRLFHEANQRPEEIESELDWILHLNRHHVGVSQPCFSRAGRLVERIEGPTSAYAASMHERSSGRELQFHKNPKDWDPEIHRQLGRLLGRLHRATVSYKPSDGIVLRHRWDTETIFRLSEAATIFPDYEKKLQSEFRELWSWLSSLPEDAACFGLTHNDAHRSNFSFEDGRITLFDMSATFYCWFAYDLAQPLYYSGPVFFGNRSATPEMLAELKDDLVRGYREEFPLSDIWVERIEGFVRLRRLQMHCSAYWRHGGPIEDDWFVRNGEAMAKKEPLI
jgi:amicoumacin kinase